MKRIATIIPESALGLVDTSAMAGQEARVYDAQGREQGRAFVNNANSRQQNLYDARGRYVGRVLIDVNGNFLVFNEK